MGKIKLILEQLINNIYLWYIKNKRSLPWREHPTYYNIWISEIMLQQTKVKTVIPYYHKFINRFPDVSVLASANIDEVMLYWAGLGYYSRAKNLHKAAKIIHKIGKYPKTKEEWLKLPGIGRYTVGAILSIAKNKPEAILDGNIKRIFARIRKINHLQNESRLWRLSNLFLAKACHLKINPRDFNQALMEFGALVCTPKNFQCFKCPINNYCKAYKKNVVIDYPPKKVKNWKKVNEKVFCIFSHHKILIEKQSKKWRSHLWDFPDHIPAVINNDVLILVDQFETKHIVTNHKINRKAVIYKTNQQNFENIKEYKWVSIPFDHSLAVGAAFKKTLQKLESYIKN